MNINDRITVIVVTSPVPSNPSTAIITETLESIRWHLPSAKIIVLADGIRPEEEERRDAYMTYLGYLANLLVEKFSPAYFAVSYKHVHQIGMMRRIVPTLLTDLLLFVEHDTPLLKEGIDWKGIVTALLDGVFDYIRFNPEPAIPEEHSHLMLGAMTYCGVPVMRTIQFHARPHLARVDFYKRLLRRFSPEANCFIEDKAHSICQTEGWDTWKLAIYTPEGNQKRSTHTNAREGARKWDDLQTF